MTDPDPQSNSPDSSEPPEPAKPSPPPWRPIRLPADDEELKAQCEVHTFRASGPGGQHVNTTDTAVRLVHRESGITVVSRQGRSQHLNLRDALQKLRDRVELLNHKPKRRKKTRVPKSVKQKRLQNKKATGKKKENRRRPGRDD
jgi:protein subunit release factor B